MSDITEYLLDFTNELGKEGYSIIKAGVKTLYKVKGELAAYTIDNYMNTRFEIRLEDFAFEQDKLSKEAKENFYKNINAKQLNFLFELLERARTSTYDLHAKILSRLYANLILNGNLNYHESTLLSNINIMNDEDFFKFTNLLDSFLKRDSINLDTMIMKQECLNFKIESYTDLYIYDKLLRVGLIAETNIIDAGNLTASGDVKLFYIHSFSKEMYLLMKEISRDSI
jgi:hypothetical protein